MARLTITFSNLYTKVSEMLGLGSSPTGTDLTKVKDIVQRGYRMFLYPIDKVSGDVHNWSFTKQFITIPVVANKWKYLLPSDFSDFITEPYFASETTYPPLVRIGPEQIIESRSISISTGYPISWALAPFKYDNQIGTRYEFWVDPIPDGNYPLSAWYKIDPDLLSDDADLPVGGVKSVEALIECCLSKAEIQEDDKIGIHTQLAEQLLQQLILSDVKDESGYLGNLAYGDTKSFKWFTPLPPFNSGDNVYVGD